MSQLLHGGEGPLSPSGGPVPKADENLKINI